jgi:hypothetical protein
MRTRRKKHRFCSAFIVTVAASGCAGSQGNQSATTDPAPSHETSGGNSTTAEVGPPPPPPVAGRDTTLMCCRNPPSFGVSAVIPLLPGDSILREDGAGTCFESIASSGEGIRVRCPESLSTPGRIVREGNVCILTLSIECETCNPPAPVAVPCP